MVGSKVLELIKERHSVRGYLAKPVEDEKLAAILEAARLAPSASNSQPWHFYVVKDKAKIAALAGKMPLGTRVVLNSFIAEAPVVVVATAGPVSVLHRIASFIVNRKWYYIDIGIALEHMVLTAWELGVGSCWIGWFDQAQVKKLLKIPGQEEVIVMLTLGYEKERSVPVKQRKDLSEITRTI